MRNWFLPSNENTSGHNDSGGLPLVDLSYHLLQPLDTANECMRMYAWGDERESVYASMPNYPMHSCYGSPQCPQCPQCPNAPNAPMPPMPQCPNAPMPPCPHAPMPPCPHAPMPRCPMPNAQCPVELLIYPGHDAGTCGFCGVCCGYSLTVAEL